MTDLTRELFLEVARRVDAAYYGEARAGRPHPIGVVITQGMEDAVREFALRKAGEAAGPVLLPSDYRRLMEGEVRVLGIRVRVLRDDLPVRPGWVDARGTPRPQERRGDLIN